MVDTYEKQIQEIKDYNEKKIKNWESIQNDQYFIDMDNMIKEIDDIIRQSKESNVFLEKMDLKKNAPQPHRTGFTQRTDFLLYQSPITQRISP